MFAFVVTLYIFVKFLSLLPVHIEPLFLDNLVVLLFLNHIFSTILASLDDFRNMFRSLLLHMLLLFLEHSALMFSPLYKVSLNLLDLLVFLLVAFELQSVCLLGL